MLTAEQLAARKGKLTGIGGAGGSGAID